MIKINLGCGVLIKSGWINVDKFLDEEGLKGKKGYYENAVWEEGAKFVKADIVKLPFPDDYADVIEAHQVLEHLQFRLIPVALKEVYRVLKPGGRFYADVPSMDGLALDWLEMSTEWEFNPQKYHDVMECIYGNQAGETGEGETHRAAFNKAYFNYVLNQAGFTKGTLILARKNAIIRDFGELVKGDPHKAYRYDNLLCELTK